MNDKMEGIWTEAVKTSPTSRHNLHSHESPGKNKSTLE
jgi:hypothetical protein